MPVTATTDELTVLDSEFVRELQSSDLQPGPGIAPFTEGGSGCWEIESPQVRFSTDAQLAPGWYQVRISIQSGSRFTVHKRCDLVFDPADSNPRPPGRETFTWNRNFDEQFVMRLNRPARGVRLDLHRADGPLELKSFEVRWIPHTKALALAVKEKFRLIRAYRCARPVLIRGGKLLLTGRFRQFGAKVLKGLIDSRVIRLGTGHADEVDAAWWRRHTLSADEAERIAQACDAIPNPPAIAVILPVDPGQLDPARLAAHSIRRQIYPHWELHFVTAGPAGVAPHLEHLIGRDSRIRVTRVPKWSGLAVGIGKALSSTECEHAVILPPGVELAEHALYHLANHTLTSPDVESLGSKVYEVWHSQESSETSAPIQPIEPTEPEDESDSEDAKNSTKKPEKFPIPPVVWSTGTKRLAELLPWRLTPKTVAAWATEAFTESGKVLDPVLAFPIDDRPLMDRARVGRKPNPPRTKLFVSTDLKGITGYDYLAFAVLKGLPNAGADLRLHQVSSVRGDLVPPGFLPQIGGWKSGENQLILSPPFLAQRFEPDHASALFTMWETDRLEPAWVKMMNRCRVVIVPSQWGADCFRNCGVTVPVEVVPLGYDPLVFHPGSAKPPKICTFGTAGALAAGGLRKNAQLMIDLFRQAFPTESDVRLRVKITPSSPSVETFDDPRIDVIRAVLPHSEVADWYRSLTAYVNGSTGEGFGLHLLEAMACGRPLISAAYSGLTAFFEPSVGYSVDYRKVSVSNAIYSGTWAEPDETSIVTQLRRVYSDRAEAEHLGILAVSRATNFTWKAAGRTLVNVLKQYEFLS